MNCIRNILLFVLFAIITAGCGGGNTTIAANNADSNTNATSTTSTSINPPVSSSGNTAPTTTGSAVLHWSAPTTRADNTAISLSDISAYRLYYGPSATDTPNFINVNSGAATQYTVTLPSGTYYFRIAAIDTTGYEGLKSTALKISL